MADAKNATSRALVWLGVVLVLVAGIVLLIRRSTHKPVPVRAASADLQPITRQVSTNGKVELVGEFQAHAALAGQIQRILVKVDDVVRPGQELVRMSDADARQRVENGQYAYQSAVSGMQNLQNGGTQDELLGERADLTAAQTAQKEAAQRLDTLQQLQSRGEASANEVAAARSQLTADLARVNQLSARLKGRFSTQDLGTQKALIVQAKAQLDAAQSDLGNLDIRTPIGGTVYAIPIAQYAYVNAGDDLVNVANLDHIQVRAYFDEPEIGHLQNGQAVRIVWTAKPDRTWHGHIVMAPTSVTNYGSRNVGQALIQVDDAHGDLLPNTNVTVYVTTMNLSNVLSLPREALRTDGATSFVWAIENGHLHRTTVVPGIVSLTRVQILSGLKAGDEVALSARGSDVELQDGMAVKATP